MLLANGVMRESWGYNVRLQPSETRLVRTAEPAANLAQLQYFYCASQAPHCNTNNGNLVRQWISYSALAGEAALDVAQDFTYDGLNRLWTFVEGSASGTNTYDAWGNRWATAVGLAQHALMPKGPEWFGQANNRIWSTTNPVSYDASGNQETYTPYTVAYDGENRPVTVRSSLNRVLSKGYSSGTPGVAYCYDGDTSGLCTAAPTGAGLNLTGRLTIVTNGVSEMRYGQYDAIGRPLSSSQVMTVDGAVKTFLFSYT